MNSPNLSSFFHPFLNFPLTNVFKRFHDGFTVIVIIIIIIMVMIMMIIMQKARMVKMTTTKSC